MYEKYLHMVVTNLPSDYMDINDPSINDILMRYTTLIETNADLRRIHQKNLDNIEMLHNQFTALLKANSDMILVINSELGSDQKRLDKSRQWSSAMEKKMEDKNRTGMVRMRELAAARMAIENLYLRAHSKFSDGFSSAPPPSLFAITTNSSSTNGGGFSVSSNTASTHIGANVPSLSKALSVGKQRAESIVEKPSLLPPPSPSATITLSEKLHFIKNKVFDYSQIVERVQFASLLEKTRKQDRMAESSRQHAKIKFGLGQGQMSERHHQRASIATSNADMSRSTSAASSIF